MEVRYLSAEDYDNTLVKWWESWRWTPPSRDMLPDNGTGGIMVFENGIEICAGFIYFTNSKTAWIEYIVSNQEFKDRPKRIEAINFLINVLSAIAKDKGYKFAYASLKNEPLVNRYKDCGFLAGSKSCQEVIKIL